MQPTKKRSLTAGYKICQKCIYDSSVPSIVFDEKGICNYCKMTDDLIAEYGTGNSKGQALISKIIEEIKEKEERAKEEEKLRNPQPVVPMIN